MSNVFPYRIKKSDLSENHPESVAKLLVYLEHINSESYARTGERELIGILRNADIPDRLKLDARRACCKTGIYIAAVREMTGIVAIIQKWAFSSDSQITEPE